jgi:hypothetical protein
MRYITLGIIAAAASALMLSLAPVKAQNAQQLAIGDYNGPTRQHGMCVKKGDIDGLGHLDACAPAKKSARRTGGPSTTANSGASSSE